MAKKTVCRCGEEALTSTGRCGRCAWESSMERRLSALERTRCPDPGEGAVSLADAALDRLGRGGMVFGPPSIAERNAQTVGDLIGLRRPEVAHPHARLEALREKAEPLCRPAPDPAPAVTREEILRVLRLARGEIDMEAAPLTYDAVNDLIAELDAEGGPRG